MKQQTVNERLDETMSNYHVATFEDLTALDELDRDDLHADLPAGWLLVAIEDRFRIGTHIFKLPADELENLKHYAARRFCGYTAYKDIPGIPEPALGKHGVQLRHNIFLGPKRLDA